MTIVRLKKAIGLKYAHVITKSIEILVSVSEGWIVLVSSLYSGSDILLSANLQFIGADYNASFNQIQYRVQNNPQVHYTINWDNQNN